MNIALVYLWAYGQAASAATREAPDRAALIRLHREHRAAWRLYDDTRKSLGIPYPDARYLGDPLAWVA